MYPDRNMSISSERSTQQSQGRLKGLAAFPSEWSSEAKARLNRSVVLMVDRLTWLALLLVDGDCLTTHRSSNLVQIEPLPVREVRVLLVALSFPSADFFRPFKSEGIAQFDNLHWKR